MFASYLQKCISYLQNVYLIYKRKLYDNKYKEKVGSKSNKETVELKVVRLPIPTNILVDV